MKICLESRCHKVQSFFERHKSNDMTLQAFDIAVINTSCKEVIKKTGVENNRTGTKWSPSFPLGRVENDCRVKSYFKSQFL